MWTSLNVHGGKKEKEKKSNIEEIYAKKHTIDRTRS